MQVKSLVVSLFLAATVAAAPARPLGNGRPGNGMAKDAHNSPSIGNGNGSHNGNGNSNVSYSKNGNGNGNMFGSNNESTGNIGGSDNNTQPGFNPSVGDNNDSYNGNGNSNESHNGDGNGNGNMFGSNNHDTGNNNILNNSLNSNNGASSRQVSQEVVAAIKGLALTCTGPDGAGAMSCKWES
ncbi:hypothetical protein F4802DRAFT_570603 [Xylaria palmicola]|nr:hypothetical protein F4802DRAFT_570603 [Xylaria palmicola]